MINKSWNKGFTYTGDLNKDSAQYICGYVTKKMTNKNDEKVQEWLDGRYPEFARMSLRPGIGAPAVGNIVDVLETEHGCDLVAREGDIPNALQMGRKQIPLGS